MILFYLLATVSTLFALALATLTVSTSAIVAGLLGVSPNNPDSLHHSFPRWWSKIVITLSFVRIKVHAPERAFDGKPHIYVANHLSFLDVPVLASFIPRAKFVTKEELFSVPIFGKGMLAVGMVPIQRERKKAAFGALDYAAKSVKAGNSIVVFPEGTRGNDYSLRPFKRGPFVLAITAGATIVPVVIHGTHDVLPKGTWLVRPRRVDVHLLEHVSVEGLDLSDRDRVASEVWSRMANALETHYGVKSVERRSTAPVPVES